MGQFHRETRLETNKARPASRADGRRVDCNLRPVASPCSGVASLNTKCGNGFKAISRCAHTILPPPIPHRQPGPLHLKVAATTVDYDRIYRTRPSPAWRGSPVTELIQIGLVHPEMMPDLVQHRRANFLDQLLLVRAHLFDVVLEDEDVVRHRR